MHALADAFLGLSNIEGGVIAITDEQGESLTNACMDVMAQYDLTVSPKVAAWGNLITVAGLIYYPKIRLIQTVKKMQAQERARAHNPIVDMQTETPAPSDASKMVFA